MRKTKHLHHFGAPLQVCEADIEVSTKLMYCERPLFPWEGIDQPETETNCGLKPDGKHEMTGVVFSFPITISTAGPICFINH